MNKKIEAFMLNYFRPPQDYFWKWANNGEVIEWQNGQTICYREDLIPILKGLTPNGLPPMGSVLLGIAMCQDSWLVNRDTTGILKGITQLFNPHNTPKETLQKIDDYLDCTIQFMDLVATIDKNYRSGNRRITLLQEAFKNSALNIPAEQGMAIISLFESGNYDNRIFGYQKNFRSKDIRIDLASFVQIASKIPTKEKLELLLRTGILELPEPVELELPEATGDLLEQLAEDPRTTGLVNLTKRLVAALNIPMHTLGTSDQSFGGVSDITNRGDFDKLLLSELAYEDQSLMARLVNNEALYFHHEEPPVPLNQSRVILVDSTIKMWGIPKVFALSAALACVQNNKHQVEIEALTLSGKNWKPLDLTTKAGIIEGLEKVAPDLDCTEAVIQFLKDRKTVNQTEYILITQTAWLDSQSYYQHLETLQHDLNFLIAVNRKGELFFYQFTHGKRKLISNPKFDLATLLFSKEANWKAKPKDVPASMPAFLKHHPYPLRLPTTGMRLNRGLFHYDEEYGIVGINEVQRVLYYPELGRGAIELMEYIEDGKYAFAILHNELFILVYRVRETAINIHKIDLTAFQVESVHIPIGNISYNHNYKYFDHAFWGNTHTGVIKINLPDLTVEKLKWDTSISQQFYKQPKGIDFGKIKQRINMGYSVIQRVSRVYINGVGQLCISNRVLLPANKQLVLKKIKTTAGHPTRFQNMASLIDNERVEFRKFTWTDGSTAIVDARGMIHLKSSNQQLPELTLLLIIGRGIPAWSAAEKVTGEIYFTGTNIAGKLMKGSDFYETFLRPFIATIQAKNKRTVDDFMA